MKIIGLSGTNGSGKDTVGLLIAEKYNFLFISVSDLLREEVRRRGLEVARENLRSVSEQWRREGGVGVLVDKAVEHYKTAEGDYQGLVMASLRNPGEIDRLHELDGTAVWVDADPRIRYERIQSADRGRGGEDNKTYEEFLREEEDEMRPPDSNDPNLLNGAGVKALADVTIINESDLTALTEQLAVLLKG